MTTILGYRPVMTSAQRWAFRVLVPLLALLGANSLYLVAIPEEKQNQFYFFMFLLHLVLGVLLILPFAAFIILHVRAAWGRENKRAIKAGLVLLAGTLAILATGGVMTLRLDAARSASPFNAAIYWLHVLVPLLAVAMYVVHRRAGPRVHWNWGFAWGVCVALFVGAMSLLHGQDPRRWHQVGSPEGEKYFEPSLTRTATGKFIPAESLMMDRYCLRCHEDHYAGWFHSAHRFSSFNNPAYRFSVRETRKVTMAHDPDGIPRGARWCAGCHDQVPFLSGRFDDPGFDDVNDPTAHAGITCTVCHAITNVNLTRGNGDYTIEEPVHYPFAYSDNPVLQWINNRLVKAKPAFHKKTFLKPFHRTAEFCSTCHKVSLPFELNQYKEFLRGQNHYDSFLLSGVSGHGARSFYYPPKAKSNCADCHMPLAESDDIAARDFDGRGRKTIHTHLFQSANTAVAAMRGDPATVQAHADYLTGADPKVIGPSLRIDIFGLKEGGEIDRPLIGPIRPELPALRPGGTYLLEVVLRTLNVGHHFTQGTVDSNEVWVNLTARSGDRVIGGSGAIGDDGQVDPWSHFINVHMLDRHGNRVDRRNAQDIFTPLYNNQLPPGAGQVAHYRLEVPPDADAPVEIIAVLNYRKFDRTYMNHVFPNGDVPELPVVAMCRDRVVLPVEGVAADVPEQRSPIEPAWQRWNDYGIGLLLKGEQGSEKGELIQAEAAFRKVAELSPPHGLVNLARVFLKEGRLAEATDALQRASALDPPADWWTVAWFNGLVDKQNGHLDSAIRNFETIINNPVPQRGFEFSRDYVVLNELGLALFERAKQTRGEARKPQREQFIRRAIERFEQVLAIDSENLTAHYNLSLCFQQLATIIGGPLPDMSGEGIAYLTDAELIQSAEGWMGWRQGFDGVILARSIDQYCANLRAASRPTLPVIRKLRQVMRSEDAPQAWSRQPQGMSRIQAHILAMLHRHEYLAYKPDDNARDRAVAAYRSKNAAANHASQSVVIYPLTDRHREELLRRGSPVARAASPMPPAAAGDVGTVQPVEATRTP